MEINIRDSLKIVEIWLTNVECCDATLRQSLQPLYEKYKQLKYKVAVFESGNSDLLKSVTGLLLHNRKIN